MSDDRYRDGCAWIDGEYLPISEARIPIVDSGFSRSDVTYDVVAVWNGAFFRLDDHLARFESSWRRLRMSPPVSPAVMRDILFTCVRRSGLHNAYVDMIMSRGTAPLGMRDPRQFVNRFYAYAIPYIWLVEPEDQEVGTHLVVCRDTVRISPQSVDPTIKNFQWGDLVRGMFEAYDRGGTWPVLVDAEGYLTEGPGFNLFVVHAGALSTPDRGVLEGITRRTVLELAADMGLPATLERFRAEVLQRADEIFITSTAGGIMPITVLDDQRVGDGTPGAVTMALRQRYWDAHDDPRWATPVA